jgi:DNA mismatch repair protein MutL
MRLLETQPGEASSVRRIKPLAALVANQIAAGEVVERPASVVKELVENALDAGATRVVVELEAGGIELVRITDDGAGIEPEDLPLAIAPHATSKISDAADLDHIGTLGFRGEALASIASVSRLSLRSRTAHQAGAMLLEVEGSTHAPPRPAAGPPGTCVSVRNLFFNTPARRKFLRTAQTEKERCTDVFEQLALAHPAVGFTLVVDGRLSQEHAPNQGPRARVLSVLGREVDSQMVEVHADRFDDARGVALWGLAGLPSLARGSVKGQHVFVNGRAIKDRTIQHAIAEAYRGLIEPGRYPTLVLMLALSPEGVDVNVHPQKAEVRFRDGSMVHSTVLRALREALARADLTPSVGALRPQAAWGPGMGAGTGSGLPKVDLLGASPSSTGLPLLGEPAPAPGASAAKFAAYFSRFSPGKDQFPLSLAEADLALRRKEAADADARTGSLAGGDAPAPDQPAIPTPAAKSIGGGEGALLQVHNSYVVTQDEQGVVIIDQHALHERAMFEYLAQRVLAGSLESQRLLMPVVVPASHAASAALLGAGTLLARIGVELCQLGTSSVGVQAFPSFLLERGVEVGEFVEELLRKAEAGELQGASAGQIGGADAGAEHALRDVLDMMACKAAVKAGDHLTPMELAELVKLREDVERSSNCPHGRPTSIRLTIRELERLIGRA